MVKYDIVCHGTYRVSRIHVYMCIHIYMGQDVVRMR